VELVDGLLLASCQPGYAKAAGLIADAIQLGQGIFVFGDYDVDGITSTAIWKTVIRAFNVRCETKIPARAEGYGFSSAAAGQAAGLSCSLVLCVDSGTDRVEEIDLVLKYGIQAVVVDHHLPKDERDGVSRPTALVNGHFSADPSMRLLCAAGQSYALAIGVLELMRRRGQPCPGEDLLRERLLQLATVGTISDMMELRGYNRALVREGLALINLRPLAGLYWLAQAAGIRRAIKADTIGYALGPMINATGRYSRPELALDLLLGDDPVALKALALEMQSLNARRQGEQKAMIDEAMERVDRSQPVAFYRGFDWEKGLVGLVAGGVMQNLQRPALVASVVGDIASGSGRSTPGFDLGHAVIEAQQAGLLVSGGGHAAACGFTCRVDQIEPFLAFIRRRFLMEHRPVAHEVDLVIDQAGVSVSEFDTLARLAPYGHGWLQPKLAVEVTIRDSHLIGERHETIRIGCGFKAVAFRVGHNGLESLLEAHGRRAILIATPQVGEWQGARSAEMIIEDVILL
jgi:single-stranded-DNA-specific exonuclease